MTAAFRLGLITAAVTLVLDQATKLGVLFVFNLPEREHVVVTPFMDLVMVWNRGISYGLFQQEGELGRWLLTSVMLAASVFIFFWMRREFARINTLALGLLLGGAIGNMIDRVAYGAVADFVLLHGFGYQWYVFNIADAAIVAGVAFLLYGALPSGRRGVDTSVKVDGDGKAQGDTSARDETA